MKNGKGVLLLAGLLLGSSAFFPSQTVYAQDNEITPEVVVANHLKSIGKPEVLKEIKNRGFDGTTSVEFIQGGTGNADGIFLLLSEGPKVAILLRYNDLEYPGEYFAFDGKDVSVGYITPGQRSPVADFIFRYNRLMKEGLLGGTLSCAWPLLHLQGENTNLVYDREEKDGRRLHRLEYRPEKNLGDLRVKLYFDFDTFRHVRTEYRVRINMDMSVPQPNTDDRGGAMFQNVPDSIYVLTEKFDDYREEGGLMLPHKYTIDYSLEGQGQSFVACWTAKLNNRVYNGKINPQSFVAQR
jgi:hypothetical protein